MMSKLTRIQKILISFISIAIVFSIVLNIFRMQGPIEGVAKAGYDFFTMLKYSLVEYPVKTVEDFFTSYTRLWQVQQENDILRKKIDEIESNEAKLIEAKQTIQQLKDLNNLKTVLNEYDLIETALISRSYEFWNNYITIDAGSNEGVLENLAVVTSKGLIGRVQTVNEDSSIVKLITTEDGLAKVSVKIQVDENTMADAILEHYDTEKEAFVVKLIHTGSTITTKMVVTTSGMGGVFPSGLLVGTVSEIEALNNAVGMNIYVKPAADFHNMNYVAVVKRSGSVNND